MVPLKRPTLCIVAGPNGSGKTTTTIQLLANEWAEDSQYINPDNIAQETFGDWNSWSSEGNRKFTCILPSRDRRRR